MTSGTKDSEGTWLSPPGIYVTSCGRDHLSRRGLDEDRERGGQVILTGQTERSRVRFEVLAGGGSRSG